MGQNLILVLEFKKIVGNDSSPHLKMFGEVSKPLSAEMSEILISRPKFRNYPNTLMSILQISLIINCPVSCNVDKAYKVILPNFWRCLDKSVIRQ